MASAATLLRVLRISIVAKIGPKSIGRSGIYFVLTPTGYFLDYSD